jgi:ATP-dependent exoDNAse (exonuclease V) beta subunit
VSAYWSSPGTGEEAASNDEEARRTISEQLDANFFVVAGAGTGKTTSLVNRVVSMVTNGDVHIGHIAAITFTEAAAGELRERVRQELQDAVASGALSPGRIIDIDEAAICTIHAFAQRILAEHCLEAGLPPGFEIMDDTAYQADIEDRWQHFAENLLDDPGASEALRRGFATGLDLRHLRGLAGDASEHWDRLTGPAMDRLIAPAPSPGAWPTVPVSLLLEALDTAARFASRCDDPEDHLMAFLESDVASAADRLRRTDPGDAVEVLQLLAELPVLSARRKGREASWRVPIAEVRNACEHAEQLRAGILAETRQAVLATLGPRVAEFVRDAADHRRDEGRIGFHDLLVRARNLIVDNPQVREQLHRRYRHLLIDEFQDTDPLQVDLAMLLVTSLGDAACLDADEMGGHGHPDGHAGDGSGAHGAASLLRHAQPGRLLVVGDPKQSIYRFRRADLSLFDQVGKALGNQLALQRNFRSVPGILAWVNAVFEELLADGMPGEQAAHSDLLATREALHSAAQPGPPVVILGGGHPPSTPIASIREASARELAAAIISVVDTGWRVQAPPGSRPARFGDIAVLMPTRTSLPAIERALEDAGIPYRLEGAALLWRSPEVHDVLSVLRAADDPADPVAVLTALRSPLFGCGDDEIVEWRRAGGAWDPLEPFPGDASQGCQAGQNDRGNTYHRVASSMAELARLSRCRWYSEPSDLVEQVIRERRCFELACAGRRPRDRWNRLRWLQDQARLFDETLGGTLRDFLAWTDLQRAGNGLAGGVGPPDPDDDAVRVMTIHGAKGLEFPVVVLAGLEQPAVSGRWPQVLFDNDGTVEMKAGSMETSGYADLLDREKRLATFEALRLLYVGATRARDHLIVSVHHREVKSPTAARSHAHALFEVCSKMEHLWKPGGVACSPGELPDDVPAGSRGYSHEQGSSDLRSDLDPELHLGPGPDLDPDPGPDHDPDLDPDEWSRRRAAWVIHRQELIDTLSRQPVLTATDLAQGSTPTTPGPTTPHSITPGSVDRAAALAIGRSVHQVLAVVDLATGKDPLNGQGVAEMSRRWATVHGVQEYSGQVASMVLNALACPVIRAAALHRHWREMYVAAPSGPPGSPVIEGFVDLLFDDGEGLVIVDYKTDRSLAIAGSDSRTGEGSGRVGRTTKIEGTAMQGGGSPPIDHYRLQVAAYASALESATGRLVKRGVLCFVAGPEPVEIEVNDLRSASGNLTGLAALALHPGH